LRIIILACKYLIIILTTTSVDYVAGHLVVPSGPGLGSEVVGPSLAADLVRTFLAARFDGEERHATRLEMIRRMEEGMRNG
jgi:hypothetical protein